MQHSLKGTNAVADYLGKQFGNYRLVQLLGQGSFAAVYLGEHCYLKSYAALKVLHVSLSERIHSGNLEN